MKRIAFLLLILGGLPAVDVLTVDPAGTVVVAGTTPAAAAATEVRLGNGMVRSGSALYAGSTGRLTGSGNTTYLDSYDGTVYQPMMIRASGVGVLGDLSLANNLSYARTDGTDFLVRPGVNGPYIRMRAHSGLGGDANRLLDIGWQDNAGVRTSLFQINDSSTAVFLGSVPTLANLNEVRIGGGVIRSAVANGSNLVLEKANGASVQFVESGVNGFQITGNATHDLLFWSGGGSPTVRATLTSAGALTVGGTISASTVNTGALNTTGIATINGAANFLGGNSNGSLIIHPVGAQSIGNSPPQSSLEIQTAYQVATEASYISFHRAGLFAAHFGLDTDNILKLGGWSYGAAAYRVMLGDGYSNSGPLSLTGSLSAGNVTIGRTTQATTSEAVRGDDPRLINAIGTGQIGVAGGIASLDAAGKVPFSQLSVGGSGIDGILQDATTVSLLGRYEFASINLTAAKALPCCTIIRANGNCRIGAVLSVTPRSLKGSPADTSELEQLDCLDATFGHPGIALPGGGGSIGSGGGAIAAAGSGRNLTLFNHWFQMMRPFLGGHGSGGANDTSNPPGRGGGSLILIVDGDLDCTGGTIQTNGGNTNANGPGSVYPGAGGAGSLIVICTGTITGGQFEAKGGLIDLWFDGSCGGGGGLVQLVASGYATAPTMVVTGGAGPGGNGAPGLAQQFTYSKDQIKAVISSR